MSYKRPVFEAEDVLGPADMLLVGSAVHPWTLWPVNKTPASLHLTLSRSALSWVVTDRRLNSLYWVPQCLGYVQRNEVCIRTS